MQMAEKYFINHLAIHNCFKGEIELIDHLIKQDYFEEYYTKSQINPLKWLL